MRSPDAAFDLRAALTQELRAAIEEFDASAEEPKALHRCRVRLKRARALARVGRACAPGLSEVFNDTARAAMHLLAGARDLAALEDVARATAKKVGRKDAAALLVVAESLAARRRALAPIDQAAVNASMKDLLALAQVWPEASPRQIRRGAIRIARRARRARRRAEGANVCARRHEWRRREKDRLHAALLLDYAWPRKKRLKAGAKLGDVLGHERDALQLMERIAEEPMLAGDARAAGRALDALNARRVRLAQRADDLAERVHAGGA